MQERTTKISTGCRREKRRMCILIRKVRPIAEFPEDFSGSSPVLRRHDASAAVAKCLRPDRAHGRDKNMVDEGLKRGGLDAMLSAAGADDQGGGIVDRES